jgi:single-strand selective monofunctional uracil DNA glycosylase
LISGLGESAGARAQLEAAAELRDRTEEIARGPAFSGLWVYNPLVYAWKAFEKYVTRYGAGRKRVLFLGMNPGPWGMAQTGVPFGEVSAVRDWLGISVPVGRPPGEHPKYPVDGFACKRSEVSGKRLWGLFAERFGGAGAFFREHFVVNYCPLLFLERSEPKSGKEGARNLTPDKLPPAARLPLYEACDGHLRALAGALSPQFVVGIGSFAAARAGEALSGMKGEVAVGKILHPSPASPRSNAGWAAEAERQLVAQKIWPPGAGFYSE